MVELYIALISFVFGTIIGSFLNVVVLRYGFDEGRRVRSGCMACGETLRSHQLIPLFSFVLAHGRCAECGSKLSVQYPMVEFTVGVLFLASFLISYPFSSLAGFIYFILLLVFWSAFTLLVVYDIRHTLLPLPFALTLIGSAGIARIAESLFIGSSAPLFDALLGALLFGGFLFFLYVITAGRGMGFGDVYIGLALGLIFGVTESFDVAALSFWIGAGVSVLLLAFKKGVKMRTEVPFVPFLFTASALVMFTDFSPLAVVARIITGV